MPDDQAVPPRPELIGTWEKTAGTDGELAYPDVLELRGTTAGAGTYLGRRGRAEQSFLVWDAGTWSLLDEGSLQLSTATDAQQTVSLTAPDADRLVLETGECRLTYERRRAAGSTGT